MFGGSSYQVGDDKYAFILRLVRMLLITLSIAVTFYVMVVQKDYEILTNPDGPDTSDYFEE